VDVDPFELEPINRAGETKPCEGLLAVEVAVGTSDLGLGLVAGVPGMILAHLGARVQRVVGSCSPGIDEGVHWGYAWHRDKEIIVSDDRDEVFRLLKDADVALVYGSEDLVESRGLGYQDLKHANPSLVYARCRPSRTSRGTVDDYGLLVEARSGFCSQLAGHRPGPIFIDVRAPGTGAALVMTVSVLGLLLRRARIGEGGWAEASLYDGLLATLGTMIGRSERAAPEVERYWEKGSTFPNFLYRCSDGELIQVWFGGKGMYASLLATLGDEPSTEGYYTDQVTGALNARAERWKGTFAREPRKVWIERLRAAGVACEPVLGPGDVLSDVHLTESGVAETRTAGGHREVFVATPISVSEPALPETAALASPASPAPREGDYLLDGLRVLDFSAFVAGPLAAEVLADLGADVIKVEPPEGEAMRAAAYATASCQRGKRSLALDIGAEDARPAVERLIEWADVVLHNFRVGVSERLGIDEETVFRLNPRAVYCHASAFGTTGPRATYPGNDALMQALTGLERAVGGAGNDPLAPTWIPLDMSGGWLAGAGVLAGLLARARHGRGCRVATSLLGAGMLVQSGTFQCDGDVVRHPEVDREQTGYGPGYRLYQGSDGRWFALVLPDREAWELLRRQPGLTSLPETYVPLRRSGDDRLASEAESILEGVFATAPAARSVTELRRIGLLAEQALTPDRDAFRQSILDDPVNRQLGRVASYPTADWGWFEQIGPLMRCGPSIRSGPRVLALPGIGEHTVDVLRELGIAPDRIESLLGAKVARQL
jgi:crotonobetainyl-CoA:carnitine CoA-transferase CaiB-like acyl-CoA transferase